MAGEDCDGTVYYNTRLEEKLFRQRFSAAISSGKNRKGIEGVRGRSARKAEAGKRKDRGGSGFEGGWVRGNVRVDAT